MFIPNKDSFVNIINSGMHFNDDEKFEQLRYKIVNFSLLFACFMIPIGIIYNIFASNFIIIFFDLLVFAFNIFILFQLRKDRKNYHETINILTIGVILFFDSLFLFSAPHELKFTWILVYTSIFIFFKGNKSGLLWILYFCLTVIILKLQTIYPISFSWPQISYFFLALGTLAGMSAFIQHVIEDNYKTIIEQKKILAFFNNELEKKIEKEVSKNREKDKIYFQQSKMAAMGEMLANIAHQWRQPLSTINVVAGGMKVHRKIGTLTDEVLDENIHSIEKNVAYLSQTISDFQDFFSTTKTKKEFDIADSISQDIRLISPTLTSLDISITAILDSHTILSYKSQLSQVILNIISNAKDALLLNDVQEKLIFVTIKSTHDEIIISIKDNAGGINEDIISKIFEPYFTTKHKSQGTGIGLFMAQEIVYKHLQGSLHVYNVNLTENGILYKGAQFDIILDKKVVT